MGLFDSLNPFSAKNAGGFLNPLNILNTVGNVVGGVLTNQANVGISRENIAAQKEAQMLSMNFAERMSNTAYQRAVSDLKSAGLNPILAYTQGGASTPTVSGIGGSLTRKENPYRDIARNLLELRITREMAGNVKAQKDKTRNEARKEGYLADVARNEKVMADINRYFYLKHGNKLKVFDEIMRRAWPRVREAAGAAGLFLGLRRMKGLLGTFNDRSNFRRFKVWDLRNQRYE